MVDFLFFFLPPLKDRGFDLGYLLCITVTTEAVEPLIPVTVYTDLCCTHTVYISVPADTCFFSIVFVDNYRAPWTS